MNKKTKIIVLMGVSGCGKTTIGKILSKEQKIPFFDADDYHPKNNIKKMTKGKSLNDKDRFPWLMNINKVIKKNSKLYSYILACSSLKKIYRKIIKKNIKNPIYFVWLKGSEKIIIKRLKNRKNHFMKDTLLNSQFKLLEEPSKSLIVDISKTKNEITKIITKEYF